MANTACPFLVAQHFQRRRGSIFKSVSTFRNGEGGGEASVREKGQSVREREKELRSGEEIERELKQKEEEVRVVCETGLPTSWTT